MDRLRIALIAEAMDTGLARLMHVLAVGLDRAGHEVHLIHSLDRVDLEVLRRIRSDSRTICEPLEMARGMQLRDIVAGMK